MNRKELLRIMAEQRDDASQRPLHEKGVRYTDEPAALREILDGKTAASEPEVAKGKDNGIEM
jgi:hypothetical protein